MTKNAHQTKNQQFSHSINKQEFTKIGLKFTKPSEI